MVPTLKALSSHCRAYCGKRAVCSSGGSEAWASFPALVEAGPAVPPASLLFRGALPHLSAYLPACCTSITWNWYEMQILAPHPTPVREKPWQWDLAIHGVSGSPGDFHTHSTLRITDLITHSLIFIDKGTRVQLYPTKPTRPYIFKVTDIVFSTFLDLQKH